MHLFSRPRWTRQIATRAVYLWPLKAVGTMGFMALFFWGYFGVLRNPLFPATVMPLTVIDEWIAFTPLAQGLLTDHPPIVAVNGHAGDPHYVPSKDRPTPTRKGDLLLTGTPGGTAVLGDLFRLAMSDFPAARPEPHGVTLPGR